ncbi:MAG: hypothetical protein HYX25_08115 [Candidatus Solibacter usitatus]|nr:hypothetical protein [Candidatus Solibacter usitatus]
MKLRIALTLAAVCLPYLNAAYFDSAQELVAQHRRSVDRLKAPAELVQAALFGGGAFYVAGSDPGWIAEATGRSGGIMAVRALSSPAVAQPGDVVWLSYFPSTYESQRQVAADLQQKKCLVIAFGPRPPSGAPAFEHWIDSLTPWTADQNFTVLGNLLSLWTLTAELASATARAGKTLVFYQSNYRPGGSERNLRYQGRTFHAPGEPRMDPVPPGVAARAYLDSIGQTLRDIRSHELDRIIAVGKEMGRRSASHPAIVTAISHLMHHEFTGDGKWFRADKGEADRLDAALGADGYLIWLGPYNGIQTELWDAVRRAKAKAVWICIPKAGQRLDLKRYGDILIDQHWAEGDAAVSMPGYDVKILPPSGIAQLVIYETMLHAAGA